MYSMVSSVANNSDAGGENCQYIRSTDQRSTATMPASRKPPASRPIRPVASRNRHVSAMAPNSIDRSEPTRSAPSFCMTKSVCSGWASVTPRFVSPPTAPITPTARTAIAHPIRYGRLTSRRTARSAPNAASTATPNETTYSMVLGARKYFVPGTRAYTRR